jgi:hypothetical protein
MNYKGAWDGSTNYDKGDVVVFTDNVAYVAVKDPPAGIIPHDTMFWNRVGQPLQEAVIMFHGAFGGLTDQIAEVAESIPKNIDDKSIVLTTDDGEYLITVDDSGDTPELAVEAIENEAEGADS